MRLVLNVNNQDYTLDVDAAMPLLWVLREKLGLTGTKFGCGMARCGACTIHVDGQALRSCVFPVGQLAGKKITTIEGLNAAHPAELHPLQKAWIEHNVPQCGFCQSGQIMQAAALLKAIGGDPSDSEIDAAMSGNLCRCGTYPRIKKAIHAAARS